MPSLDEGDGCFETRTVGVYAVHLVSQVLDEAYVIAKAAEESGNPWQYISMLKNFKFNKSLESENENLYVMSGRGVESVDDSASNVIATSTPHKTSESSEYSHASRRQNDVSYFGQGDEDYEVHQDDLNQSMLINNMFDMSEVEHVVICDDMKITQSEPNDLLTQAMTKIMESYVNTALCIADEGERVYEHHSNENSVTDFSAYTFLSKAFGAIDIDEVKEFTLVDTDAKVNPKSCLDGSRENVTLDDDKVTPNKDKQTENDASFEKTFLTLNRDFEPLSDEEDFPILQDPKGLAMHEIDLSPTKDTEDTSIIIKMDKGDNEFRATSAIATSAGGSRKSSLVRRCRLQGARLLSCFRGWWRRKTPGKRKECLPSGSVRGFCPLSPQARLRAASLLDNRNPRSPSPSRSVIWKFNTVNETLVRSTNWNNYSFVKQEVCNE